MSKKSKRSAKKKRTHRKGRQTLTNKSKSAEAPARRWGRIAGMAVIFLLAVALLWLALNQGDPVLPTPTVWPTIAATVAAP